MVIFVINLLYNLMRDKNQLQSNVISKCRPKFLP